MKRSRLHPPSGYAILTRDRWHYPAIILGPGRYGLMYRTGKSLINPIKRRFSAQAVDVCTSHFNGWGFQKTIQEVEEITAFAVYLPIDI